MLVKSCNGDHLDVMRSNVALSLDNCASDTFLSIQAKNAPQIIELSKNAKISIEWVGTCVEVF